MPDQDFLLEVGTEEIPARFLPLATGQLTEKVDRLLKDHRIGHAGGGIRVFATPCRLVVHVSKIERVTETRVIERAGPPWESARDSEGRPTPALLGFLKSAGATEKEVIQVRKKDRIFVGVRLKEKGRPAAQVLAEQIPGILTAMTFPKTMRWPMTGDAPAFARPVRWLMCLFHGRPVRFRAFGLVSGPKTCGNKFFHPAWFRPASAADYFKRLEKYLVLVSAESRREKIVLESRRLLTKRPRRLKTDMPEGLLSEVVNLTEYPTVLLGSFDPSFLSIPDAILKSAMSRHQRYFPVFSHAGSLAPHFLVVRNGPPDSIRGGGGVTAGNERVLTARFSDAKYFFESDQKKKLSDRIEGLKKVVYLEGLGTLHDRARRIRDLMVILPPRLGIDIDLENYGELAYLCKADLLTDIVREFPDLQGHMGRIYAQLEGLPPEVSAAIADHYLPKGPQDALPEQPLAALLALADKLELLLGAFSIRLRPTASADPYGLRRASIGIARILLARAWHLPLRKLAEDAAQIFPDPAALRGAVPDIMEFFRGRLESLLREQHPAEFVSACLPVSDDACEIAGKVEAMRKVSAEGGEAWLTLLRTAKRAHNIVKSEKQIPPLDPARFQQDEERLLHEAFLAWQGRLRALPDRKYTDRLRSILQMADPLHRFFEKVFVMVDDPAVRKNRLALILTISSAFRSYAEFDRIAVSD